MPEIPRDPDVLDRLWLVQAAATAPEDMGRPLSAEKLRAIDALEAAMRQTGTEPVSDQTMADMGDWVWAPFTSEYLPFWNELSAEAQAVQVAEAEIRLKSNTSTIRHSVVAAYDEIYRTHDWLDRWEVDRSWLVGLLTATAEAIQNYGIPHQMATQSVERYFLEKQLNGEIWMCPRCGRYRTAAACPRPLAGICATCST